MVKQRCLPASLSVSLKPPRIPGPGYWPRPVRPAQVKATVKSTTMRYHLSLVRMAIIKKSADNKCWRGCAEKRTLLHCWGECKLVKPLWKTVWRFLKKLKIELPYDPTIPLLGIYLDKTVIQKDTYTPVYSSTISIAKTWKQPKSLWTDEWIEKMWHMYTMEYYSAIKKTKLSYSL